MNKNNSSQPRPLRLALAALFWVAVWQVVAMAVGQGILLASPVDTLARLVALVQTGDFWRSVLFTLGHILAGYALASAAGIALATLAARCAAVADLLAPLLSAMRSVPVASFVIVALIWLRARQLSVLIAFLIVLPVVYAGALAGLREIDPKLSEMARVFRMPWHRRLCAVDLPAMLPGLSSALCVAVGLAWKSGVAAEVIGIPAGTVGEKLYKAKVYLATPDLFAWTLGIVLMNALCARLLKRGLSTLAAGLEKL
jgi:NitT/TauT family transport system permease protein